MRRLLMLLLCCALLCGAVSAANGVTGLQSHTSVNADGSCQVSMTVEIRAEAAPSGLSFPLPGSATGITLNGSSVRTHRSGGFRTVNLSKLYGGNSWQGSIALQYRLPAAVTRQEDGTLLLEIPILCGFAFPVEKMEFTVTLPGEITAVPTFTSGYHQQSIESSMSVSVSGSRISVVMLDHLLDRETLSMSLQVTDEMFPGISSGKTDTGVLSWAMAACATAAVLYWLIFLRCRPLRRIGTTTPPEGVSAGEVGSFLTGCGADLSLMVVSWAQLGYLYMDRDDSGRIFLHKRMNMGNERSALENRCFRSLFGQKRTVDGTGYHYARLCRKIAQETAGGRGVFLARSGNPKIFRGLACGAGLFSGVEMGVALHSGGVWGVLLAVLLGAGCAAGAWFIQEGCRDALLRPSGRWIPGAVALGVWLVLAAAAGRGWSAVVAAAEILAGFAAAFGGRRSAAARQTAGELLGLRHYLRSVPRGELQRLMQTNPDYYYSLAPYALALGVDRRFAQRLGRQHLPVCPYLTAAMGGTNAIRWYARLREAVDALDAGQKRLRYRRL